MKNKSLLILCTATLLFLAGCSSSRQTSGLPATGGTKVPATQASPTVIPTATIHVTPPMAQTTRLAATALATQSVPSTTPTATTGMNINATPATPSSVSGAISSALKKRLTNTCDLLNSYDLAKILVTGELEAEPVKTKTVDHPVFSDASVPATEVNCVFYEFHNPGKKDQELLQVTYWVDLPGPGASAAAWKDAWSTASQIGQTVNGIGEQAFLSKDGELSFEQNGLYFTLQVVDMSRTNQENQKITNQIASDMLKNLAAMQK